MAKTKKSIIKGVIKKVKHGMMPEGVSKKEEEEEDKEGEEEDSKEGDSKSKKNVPSFLSKFKNLGK